jgi:hypothetical protein
MKCFDCKFFTVHPNDDLQDDDKDGVCHRYPAVFVPFNGEPADAVQDAAQWCQPVMFTNDWCGEFSRQIVAA